MDHELRALLDVVAASAQHSTDVHAGRTFHRGRVEGVDVVAVRSGIGKVAAAVTATLLVERLGADRVLMVGTAGGLADDVLPGDVVVAHELLQHDLDPTPILPRFVVPTLGTALLATDPTLTAALGRAAADVVRSPAAAWRDHAAPRVARPDHAERVGAATARAPRVHAGLVVSGDTFVSDAAGSARLRADLPGALAVEMEGAAVAQACHELGVPLGVVRTVSDRADDDAHGDFLAFVEAVAAPYARDLVVGALRHL